MPDLKFTVRRNFGPYQTETTTYLKPDRKRVEEQQRYRQQLWSGGPAAPVRPPRVASITRSTSARFSNSISTTGNIHRGPYRSRSRRRNRKRVQKN